MLLAARQASSYASAHPIEEQRFTLGGFALGEKEMKASMGSTTEVLVIGGGHGTTSSAFRSLRAIEETRAVRFGPRPKIVHATVDDARAADFSRVPSSGEARLAWRLVTA